MAFRHELNENLSTQAGNGTGFDVLSLLQQPLDGGSSPDLVGFPPTLLCSADNPVAASDSVGGMALSGNSGEQTLNLQLLSPLAQNFPQFHLDLLNAFNRFQFPGESEYLRANFEMAQRFLTANSEQQRRAAIERIQTYCREHPDNPDAMELLRVAVLTQSVLRVQSARTPAERQQALTEVALQSFDQGVGQSFLANYRSPGGGSGAQEVNQAISQATRALERFRAASPDARPDDIVTRFASAEEFLRQFGTAGHAALTGAERAIDRELTTFLSAQADRETRERAVARMSELVQNHTNPTLRWMQAANSLMQLHIALQSENWNEAADRLRQLIDMQQGGNGIAGGFLDRVRNPASLVDAVRRGDADAIATLRTNLPGVQEEFDEMRIRTMVRNLSERSTPQEFEAALARMRTECGGTERVTGWTNWAEAGRAASRLSRCATEEEAVQALNTLTQMAQGGNNYARAALVALQLSGVSGERQSDWAQGADSIDGRPAHAPSLSQLPQAARERIMATAATAVSEMQRSGQTLTASEYTALALVVSAYQPSTDAAALIGVAGAPLTAVAAAGGREAQLRASTYRTLLATLEEKTGVGTPGAATAIFECIRDRVPGSARLSHAFILGAGTNPQFGEQADALAALARNGDEAALRVMAGLAAGAGGSARWSREASELLAGHLTRSPQSLDLIMDAYRRYGDNHGLLRLLPGQVSEGQPFPESVRATVREAVSSTAETAIRSGPEFAPGHQSALIAHFAMARHWTAEDADAVTRSVTPEIINHLRYAENIAPETRRRMFEGFMRRLRTEGISPAEQRSCLIGLRLTADAADAGTVAMLRDLEPGCRGHDVRSALHEVVNVIADRNPQLREELFRIPTVPGATQLTDGTYIVRNDDGQVQSITQRERGVFDCITYFDAQGRPLRRVDNQRREWHYMEGRLVSRLDEQGRRFVHVYDSEGREHVQEDSPIRRLPFVAGLELLGGENGWRRRQLDELADRLYRRHATGVGDEPTLTFPDWGRLMRDIAERTDLTEVERAFVFSTLASQRPATSVQGANPRVLDSFNPLYDPWHAIINFADGYHGPMVNLPEDQAHRQILDHEWRGCVRDNLRGMGAALRNVWHLVSGPFESPSEQGLGFGINWGDVWASRYQVACWRAYLRTGRFSDYAREWNRLFVETQEEPVRPSSNEFLMPVVEGSPRFTMRGERWEALSEQRWRALGLPPPRHQYFMYVGPDRQPGIRLQDSLVSPMR